VLIKHLEISLSWWLYFQQCCINMYNLVITCSKMRNVIWQLLNDIGKFAGSSAPHCVMADLICFVIHVWDYWALPPQISSYWLAQDKVCSFLVQENEKRPDDRLFKHGAVHTNNYVFIYAGCDVRVFILSPLRVHLPTDEPSEIYYLGVNMTRSFP